jgi:large subunit ribosomal protein L25
VSTDVTLTALPRSDFGKGAARALRRQGLVPAVMYGAGGQTQHVLLPAHETNLALRIPGVVLKVSFEGQTAQVAPRDVQRDPVKTDLLHLDLIVLSRAEVAERHALADAIELAKANAAEAGLDESQAVHVVEEAAQQGEDVLAAAANVVSSLKEQAAAFTASAEAEEAGEAEAAAGAGEEPAAE